jgi:hypothetical protein
MSCPFANIFGKPNTGPHSIRVFGFALVDSVLTIIGAYFIAKAYKINFWYSLIGFFVLGEILHYLFGANTAFIKMIGLARNCEE